MTSAHALLALLLASTGCAAPDTPARRDDTPQDADGDGWFPPEDCDDDDVAVHPDRSDNCNGVDEDCSGVADDNPSDGAICAQNLATWTVEEQDEPHGDGLGASLDGDVDGDGRNDLLFGGPGGYGGTVHLFSGARLEPGVTAAQGSDWTLVGEPDDALSYAEWDVGNGAAVDTRGRANQAEWRSTGCVSALPPVQVDGF